MRLGFRLAIALSLCCGTVAALAPTGAANEPDFSAAERAIIDRNRALAIALSVDPGVVRRILDEMAQPKPRPERKGAEKQRGMFDRNGASAPIDLSENPDIDVYLQRASPEAAYDLFQILKRVGAASGGPKR